MTFERSKGKVRPMLVRASDMQPGEPAAKPTATRGAHGHFSAGNPTGKAARFIHTVKKAHGTGEGDAETRIVARDARRVSTHVLKSLPSDAAPVRVLVAIHARHVALHAFYTAKAEEAGLTTPAGLKLLEVADRQSQRAERVLVSAQDMARVCARHEASKPMGADEWQALMAEAAKPIRGGE